MSDAPVRIEIVLISHTNSGKTALARTLLGTDVGDVRDAAHVTLAAESHTLLATGSGDTLQLWDTPGFGDSARLFKRLRLSGNPIGWFLTEVLDRIRDRPFWLSQQAIRAARDAADVVLYLVNSSESLQDAGYLPAEMKILEWLGKPVIVVLNQVGPPVPALEAQAEVSRWKQQLAAYPAVKEVLALDAFARCWVHERIFYDALGKLIDPAKAAGYERLFAVWEADNANRFREAMRMITRQLVSAVQDRQPVEMEDKTIVKSALRAVGIGRGSGQQRQKAAMNALVGRLNLNIEQITAGLLVLHKLDPRSVSKIDALVQENFAIRAPIDKVQASLLGAVLSGAATGLSADLMAGGMTLGAGALLGGVVGALTFAGAAWGFNLTTDRNQPTMRFTDDFLHSLVVASLLRYLAVIHFGRGRGRYVEAEAPDFWQTEVEGAVAANSGELKGLWLDLRDGSELGQACDRIEAVVSEIASAVLGKLYPDAPIAGVSASARPG